MSTKKVDSLVPKFSLCVRIPEHASLGSIEAKCRIYQCVLFSRLYDWLNWECFVVVIVVVVVVVVVIIIVYINLDQCEDISAVYVIQVNYACGISSNSTPLCDNWPSFTVYLSPPAVLTQMPRGLCS